MKLDASLPKRKLAAGSERNRVRPAGVGEELMRGRSQRLFARGSCARYLGSASGDGTSLEPFPQHPEHQPFRTKPFIP